MTELRQKMIRCTGQGGSKSPTGEGVGNGYVRRAAKACSLGL